MKISVVVGAALFVASAATQACSSKERAPTSESPATTSIEDIEEAPVQHLGQRVTVTGEVDEVRGPRAFVIENDDLLWDEEVLVLTRKPVRFGDEQLGEDQDVTVSGTVQYLIEADIERELGWDLSTDALEIEFDGRPVIVADTVSRVEETARWSEQDEPEGVIVSVFAVGAGVSPSYLEGKKVDLEGIPVQEITDDGLWVGYDKDRQLFVQPENMPTDLKSGDRVDIDGTLGLKSPETQGKGDAEMMVYVDAEKISKSEKTGGSFGAVPADVFVVDPEKFLGQWVRADRAFVAELISDRAFWIKPSEGASDEQRILAIVREDVPSHEMIDINAGDTIEFTGLVLPGDHSNILAGTLEQDATEAISSVPVFVTMHWKDINKIEPEERQTAGR